MRIAVYPGSFDPVTNGHLDIICRARNLFDQLIAAVLINPEKTPLFSAEERVRMLEESLEEFERTRPGGTGSRGGIRGSPGTAETVPSGEVKVEIFEGLLVRFLEEKKASCIVRGLRAVSDFEYEFQMALMNRELAPHIETVFLMTSHHYAFLSSSLVKEVASFGGGVSGLVPLSVERRLQEKCKKART